MAGAHAPEEYRWVDELIETGQLDAARKTLYRFVADDPGAVVLRVKLGLREGILTATAAMQKLVHVMRDHPDAPGARELYQAAAGESYETNLSSPAQSHPRLHAVHLPKKSGD